MDLITDLNNDNLIVYNLEQGTQEWFEAKRGVPTASEAKQILGSKTVFDKYVLKKEAQKHMIRYEPTQSYGSAKRGHELEPFAAMEFDKEMLVDTSIVGFIYNKKLKCGCSPDRIFKSNKDGYIGVEIKCFEYLNHYNRIKNGIQDDVFSQIQFSLMVTGFKYWYSVYYHPDFNEKNRLIIEVVKRQPKFIEGLKILTQGVNKSISN